MAVKLDLEVRARITRADAYLHAGEERLRRKLAELIRFPSVSTQAAHAGDILACARWLAEHLKTIGLENVRLVETGGNPIVYGDWLHAADGPTVLLYGHYDVQPPEPLELWRTPPFEATLADGRLYGRGIADNKGMIFAHLSALEAMLATDGALPCNARVIVEGEEELRADHLEAFVAASRELLRADVCLNSDSGVLAADLPTIVVGLRGMAALNMTVRTAATDLHSGKFGGVVPNAAHVMGGLLSTLHHPDGRIAVSGFYDRVQPLSAETRRAWAAIPYGDDEHRRLTGAQALVGEPGYSALERAWGRPSLDVNGVWSGYTGEGLKTVIPCEAHAKITCRLVPDQDPNEIVTLLRRHLETHLPPGGQLEIDFEMAGAFPARIDDQHPAVRAALRALSSAFEHPARAVQSGWSVPVVEIIGRHLLIPSVLMGFGLPDASEHAPNENVRIDVLERGIRAALRFWHEYAADHRASAHGFRAEKPQPRADRALDGAAPADALG